LLNFTLSCESFFLGPAFHWFSIIFVPAKQLSGTTLGGFRFLQSRSSSLFPVATPGFCHSSRTFLAPVPNLHDFPARTNRFAMLPLALERPYGDPSPAPSQLRMLRPQASLFSLPTHGPPHNFVLFGGIEFLGGLFAFSSTLGRTNCLPLRPHRLVLLKATLDSFSRQRFPDVFKPGIFWRGKAAVFVFSVSP